MTAKEKYKAQLVLVCGFALLYWVFKLKVFLFIAIAVTFISLFIPVLGDLILKVWFKLAEILARINSRILLSVVFILFVAPIAILKRLFSGNSPVKLDKQSASFYTERNHKYTSEDLKNLW
ncbi:MAG: SxtJ family membrane protein [Bacteroidia bacterium]